jgi:hypothetical protein
LIGTIRSSVPVSPSVISGGTDLVRGNNFPSLANLAMRFQRPSFISSNQTIRKCRVSLEPLFKELNPKISEDKISFQYKGTEIVIQKSDICTEPVDAIMNPANERLIAGSGISAVLKEKGGRSYKNQCKTLIDTEGEIRTGYAYGMSVALNVGWWGSIKFVVHVVAPDLKDLKQSCPNKCSKDSAENGVLLHSALYSTLKAY